jgi:hypothetical protein
MLAVGFGGLALITMVTSWLRALVLVALGSALSYQVVVTYIGTCFGCRSPGSRSVTSATSYRASARRARSRSCFRAAS